MPNPDIEGYVYAHETEKGWKLQFRLQGWGLFIDCPDLRSFLEIHEIPLIDLMNEFERRTRPNSKREVGSMLLHNDGVVHVAIGDGELNKRYCGHEKTDRRVSIVLFVGFTDLGGVPASNWSPCVCMCRDCWQWNEQYCTDTSPIAIVNNWRLYHVKLRVSGAIETLFRLCVCVYGPFDNPSRVQIDSSLLE